jgi:hypothetical protein
VGLILCLLSAVLFVTKKHLKKDQGGIVMKYQGWSFTDSYFWFGSFFCLPGRGEVC